jgi:outer membrane protein
MRGLCGSIDGGVQNEGGSPEEAVPLFQFNIWSTTMLWKPLTGFMLAWFFVALFAIDGYARVVTIAVVRDGPAEDNDIAALVEKELLRLTDDDIQVRFTDAPQYVAHWQRDRAAAALRNALSAPDVDFVLGVGPLVTMAAGAPDIPLTRPFVSTYIHYPDLPGLPVKDGKSTKQGLNTMVFEQSGMSEIEEFRGLIAFDTLYVAFANEPRLGGAIEQYGENTGITMIPVNFSEDIAASLMKIPAGAGAAVLSGMPRLSPTQRKELIEGLVARKIAVFSVLGYQDVELGALAAMKPDITTQRVRRVALNLSRLIRGESVMDLPVTLTVETRLQINARTAGAIGYTPPLRVKGYADILYPEALTPAPTLTIGEALDMAEANNVALAVQRAERESSLRQTQRARRPMLPQVGTSAAYVDQQLTVDTPLFPEKVVTAGVQVNQMIYDDRIVTDFRSSGRLLESADFELEAERLDVLGEAGRAFLGFVVARVIYRVAADNVDLTEDNLELSRVRFAAGLSGRDEVLRWESVLASRRSNLLRLSADVETAAVALNQVLGVSQDRRWLPEESDVDTAARNFWLGRLDPVFDDAARARHVIEAAVEFAVENAPELKALDLATDAIDIQVNQRARSFILPSFVASFSYDYLIDRTPEGPPGARNDMYSIEIAAIYPLFTGGGKYYDMKQQQAERTSLERQREFVRQRIEQRTRTALYQTGSSFAIIDLSRSAAESARQNLEIVQEQYTQGVVNVTDLLSAQNELFVAEQEAEASVYAFLSDLVEVQRSIAWFEIEKTPEERDAFYNRMNELIEAQAGQEAGQ